VTDIVMLELINSVNPYERGKVDAQVLDSLERMVAPISEKLASEPEFAALILQKLSTALVTGHQESAENAMRSAISLLGASNRELSAELRNRLADSLRLQGRHVEAFEFYQASAADAAREMLLIRSLLGMADVRNRQALAAQALGFLDRVDPLLAKMPEVQMTLRTAPWSMRGEAQLGQFDAARVQYDQVIAHSAKSTLGNPGNKRKPH
jgi:tetratricopeptide (TPR) repeat protein